MTHQANPSALPPGIGFSVRHEDLVLLVKIGDRVLEAQLAPQGALELARDLIVAGLAHGQARAEQRLQEMRDAAGGGPTPAH